MDKSDDKKPDLSLIFGIGKPSKDSKSSKFGGTDSDDDKSDDDDELPPGFEEAASEAFPDLQGDDDRLKAFWRAVKACTGSY